MQNYFSSKLFIQILALPLLVCFITGCQNGPVDQPSIPHIIIQNQLVQQQQDVSNFFESIKIVVGGEDAFLIPSKVRNFAYFDKTLFLVHTVPTSKLTALSLDGSIKWQLSAKSDPLTAFSSLSAVHFDQQEQTIQIFDDQKHKFYTYDFEGNFLRVEEGPKIYINDAFMLPEGTRLFSAPDDKNEFEILESSKKAALVRFEPNNNSANPDQILLRNPYFNPDFVPYKDANDFFTDGKDVLFYHRNFDDTLFQIKNLFIDPVLTFGFAKNDQRKQTLSDPNTNRFLGQQFLDDNIPTTSFFTLLDNYALVSYTYDLKEYFTMIDIKNHKTIYNTQDYQCDGKNFSGRLDYSNGILLNQMYAGNYQQLNDEEEESLDTKYLDNSFVYTILTPK